MLREYRPGPPIGRGGMADVSLAVQTGEGGFARLVVQKRMLPEVAVREDLVRAFTGEARLLARLSHPNVVQVLDVGRDRFGAFVVVEYLSGETLLTVLRDQSRRGRVLPWPVVCRIGADLAAGLAAAHGAADEEGRPRPILHRDLTPSNVMVCYSGAVKLIDFGIAKAMGTGDTRSGTIKGKLSYVAPELLRGRPVDERADLFQLGVVLWEALSGQRLFDAPDDALRVQAVLERPVPRLRALAPEVPDEIALLVERLVARDPRERPCGAIGVRRAIERVVRRLRADVTSHELGDWMKVELASRMADRVSREVDCLAGMTIVDPPRPEPPPTIQLVPNATVEMEIVAEPPPPAAVRTRPGRWRGVVALMALSGVIGAATAAVRVDGHVQAAVTREPPAAAIDAGVLAAPEPVVRPLPEPDPDSDPDPDPDPEPEPDSDPEPEPDPDPDPDPAHAPEQPRTDNLDPWSRR